MMSQKSSRPLNAILGDLPPSEGEDNFETAFERIHASWYDMVSHNRTIEAALSRQLPYLQYTFLSRLLRRDFSTAKEAENLADYIHFEYKKKLHTILVFRICPDIFPTQQMDLPFYMACRMAVKEALLLLRPYVLCTEWGTDQIVCLYTTDISQAESIPEQIPHLVQELSHTLPTEICDRLCLYVGTTVSSLHEVARSFENCQAMFQARPAAANAPFSILWYHEESARPSSYFYPYEVRSNIIQYALSGDEAQLHDALHQLLNHNIVESALPPLLFALFLNDLESTLFAILTRLELPQETYQEVYQELEMFSHLDDLQKMHHICDLFKQLCLLASQRNAAQESHFMDSVTSYIREHYVSPDLSLVGVADHFHINESYLSLSFKQHTNTNFSTYLETLRMERAKVLLHTTDKTITEIAKDSGYYSSNSFCRAFKRFWGYTPTQCRNGQIPTPSS